MNWFVNIARCKDDTLYTGITTNLKRREREHNTNNKLGAKSLRNKRPVCIVYCEEYITQNSARIGEVEIKKLKRKYKLRIIGENTGSPGEFSSENYRAASSIGRASPS